MKAGGRNSLEQAHEGPKIVDLFYFADSHYSEVS